MKLIKLGRFPVPVLYSGILAGRFAGRSYGMFIAIKPWHEENDGLLQHELQHVKQFRDDPFLFPFKYLFSKKWRCGYEVDAYKISIRYGMPIRTAASYLSSMYGLDLTMAEAEGLLRY